MDKVSLMELNLEKYYHQGERLGFDLAQCLEDGFLLRERSFREFVKNQDWSIYQDKNIWVYCSQDAIIPNWAYLILAAQIGKYANMICYGDSNALETALFFQAFEKINWQLYRDQKVIIKGCSNFPVPLSAYVEASRRLQSICKLIMYGEACSSVPVFKNKKN